jgi:hypothetical protein
LRSSRLSAALVFDKGFKYGVSNIIELEDQSTEAGVVGQFKAGTLATVELAIIRDVCSFPPSLAAPIVEGIPNRGLSFNKLKIVQVRSLHWAKQAGATKHFQPN